MMTLRAKNIMAVDTPPITHIKKPIRAPADIPAIMLMMIVIIPMIMRKFVI